MQPYYYSQLPKPLQTVYHAIYTGVSALKPSFAVPKVERHTLSEIFLMLRLDHPEIFYLTGFSYRFYPQASNVEFIPEYLFDKNKILEHQKALSARVEKLCRPARDMDEWQAEQYIHDFICQNVRYDKLKKPYSHEIIGPLAQGVGVCEGIAKSVKMLCDALGIWCIIALSEANPENGVTYRHAWNVLRLGNAYYHLDATFDNSLGKDSILRYDYFNLSDELIFRDHETLVFPVPTCNDSTQLYYRAHKLSFTKQEDVEKRVIQAIRKNKPLVFHWRGGPLTRSSLQMLIESIEKAAQQKEHFVQIRFNLSQAVFYITFSKTPSNRELIEQQANEGEEHS